METRDLELIERLVHSNEELRLLVQEHEQLERRLEAFQEKRFLSSEEEIERKRIQKLKLAGRDRIEAILARYR